MVLLWFCNLKNISLFLKSLHLLDVEECISFSCLDTRALFSILEVAVPQSYEGLSEPGVFFLSATTVYVQGSTFSLMEHVNTHGAKGSFCPPHLQLLHVRSGRCEETMSRGRGQVFLLLGTVLNTRFMTDLLHTHTAKSRLPYRCWCFVANHSRLTETQLRVCDVLWVTEWHMLSQWLSFVGKKSSYLKPNICLGFRGT